MKMRMNIFTSKNLTESNVHQIILDLLAVQERIQKIFPPEITLDFPIKLIGIMKLFIIPKELIFSYFFTQLDDKEWFQQLHIIFKWRSIAYTEIITLIENYNKLGMNILDPKKFFIEA